MIIIHNYEVCYRHSNDFVIPSAIKIKGSNHKLNFVVKYF